MITLPCESASKQSLGSHCFAQGTDVAEEPNIKKKKKKSFPKGWSSKKAFYSRQGLIFVYCFLKAYLTSFANREMCLRKLRKFH